MLGLVVLAMTHSTAAVAVDVIDPNGAFDDVVLTRRAEDRVMEFSASPLANVDPRALVACGLEAPCATRLLKSAGAAFGVVVIVDASLEPAVVSVRVWDAATGRSLGTATGEALSDRTERWFDPVIVRACEDSGLIQLGRIRVSVEPNHAIYTVDGKNVREPILVPAGTHTIDAELDGYASVSEVVAVNKGETAQVTLVLKPGGSWLGSVWLWGAVGVVVAGVVVAAAVLTSDSRPDNLCLAAAREHCAI